MLLVLAAGLLPLAIQAAASLGADGLPPLRVEYGDCATVIEGPVCLLRDDRRLRLWVEAGPRDSIEISDGRNRYPTADAVEIQGGRRFEIELSHAARVLRVRVTRGAALRDWSLELGTDGTPDWLAEARALRRAGERDRALELLRTTAVAAADAARRGSALGLMGRILLEQEEREAARETLASAVQHNLREGRRLEALEDATALSFLLMHGFRDFVAARAVLDPFGAGWGGVAEAGYYLAYFRGLIGENSDDSRTALRELAAAADQAARVGWSRHLLDSEQQMATQLQVLGRRDEASALLARWRGERLSGVTDCEHANFLTNLGWSVLLALEAGEAAEDPAPVLREAMAFFEQACPAGDRVNGALNLALAHLHAGRLEEAETALAQARRQTDSPELRMVLWSLDIEARLAVARGRPREAIDLYARLRRLAAATLSPEAAWRAEVGRAAVLEALGDRDGAVEAYAAADARLEEDLYRVPVDAGRETLVASRAKATQHYLELLLETMRLPDAFELARRSRSRMLHSLRPVADASGVSPEARRLWDESILAYQALHRELASAVKMSWMLPEDELRTMLARREARERELRGVLDRAIQSLEPERRPGPLRQPLGGELLVAFQPLPQGWATFAHDGVDVVAQRLSCEAERSAPAQLASCLLAPFADEIRAADVLRVLPVGALNRVDFQSLPFDGDVLLATVAVVYGLDLAAHPEPPPAGSRALLVADPSGNLAAARREVRVVEERLAASGSWSIDVLEGSAADSTSVLRRLEHVDLFHFAGHAEFAGSRGWSSALKLADDTSLDVAAILSLTTPPRFVVLSGCETAVAASHIEQSSIGLAQAFAVSGSAGVVASIRPVEDATTQRLVSHFYRAWLHGAPAANALRSAQLELRRADAAADWSAFRLIER
jgi:tetratricopeptide (TPR) repeat protein